MKQLPKLEMFVVVTMYNESKELFEGTMRGIQSNLYSFSQYREDYDLSKIAVIVI